MISKSSKDSLLSRTEIFPKQGSLHTEEADNFISTPNHTAEPHSVHPVFGSPKTNPCHMGEGKDTPGRIIWNVGSGTFLSTGSAAILQNGLQLSQKAVTALKLLIYYYQQHVKRRLDNYGIISISALLFLLIKVNWHCLQRCSPKFEHTWSDTAPVKSEHVEPITLKNR